jgi:hypothetical protein
MQGERKVRISPKVREAIRLMVEEGRSRKDAAIACGITDDWLYRALLRPECLDLRNRLMGALRTSEAARSIARAAKLADGAQSEHVRMDANKWLGGLDGIVPVQRTENLHVHRHAPGLTINFVSHQPHVIEGQVALPVGGTRPVIGTPHPHSLARDGAGHHLPRRVPHPSELQEGDE